MKRLSLALLLMLVFALPAFSQATEFGVLVGGSRRFVEGALEDVEHPFQDSSFSLSNNAVDLYWALQLEPELYLKLNAGRIETQVPFVAGEFAGEKVRGDADGEVQHLDALVEYRFSESFGSSGLFAGVGMYRHSAEGQDSTTAWGLSAGVTADFPLSRRYGVVASGTYHWTRADFSPRYLVVSGGFRIAF